jgi:DNA-binding NarL/FixJ family response regulator
VRVVIAEDLALLRDGMVRLLEANGFEVVAAVENADALVHAVRLDEPDIAIVDIRLPPTFRDEGLRAALELRETSPGIRSWLSPSTSSTRTRPSFWPGQVRRVGSGTC